MPSSVVREGVAPTPSPRTPRDDRDVFSLQLKLSSMTRRRMVVVLVALYSVGILVFLRSILHAVQPSQSFVRAPRTSGFAPPARTPNDPPPLPPPPSASLEEAYRAAEEEARRTAEQEAPRLEQEERQRLEKEAARAARLAERWENATRNRERVEAAKAERKRNSDLKRAARLKITVEELHRRDEVERVLNKRLNATGTAGDAAIVTTASSSGGSSSDGSAALPTVTLHHKPPRHPPPPPPAASPPPPVWSGLPDSAAKCVDGNDASFLYADASQRRLLVQSLAAEVCACSSPATCSRPHTGLPCSVARTRAHLRCTPPMHAPGAPAPPPRHSPSRRGPSSHTSSWRRGCSTRCASSGTAPNQTTPNQIPTDPNRP